jgi:hypothetical protein
VRQGGLRKRRVVDEQYNYEQGGDEGYAYQGSDLVEWVSLIRRSYESLADAWTGVWAAGCGSQGR